MECPKGQIFGFQSLLGSAKCPCVGMAGVEGKTTVTWLKVDGGSWCYRKGLCKLYIFLHIYTYIFINFIYRYFICARYNKDIYIYCISLFVYIFTYSTYYINVASVTVDLSMNHGKSMNPFITCCSSWMIPNLYEWEMVWNNINLKLVGFRLRGM